MRALRLTLIAVATAFSSGIANADAAKEAEVIVVTAPKPQPIDSTRIALPDEVELVIDYKSLSLEPPRLESPRPDRPAVGTQRPVEVALNAEAKTKS